MMEYTYFNEYKKTRELIYNFVNQRVNELHLKNEFFNNRTRQIVFSIMDIVSFSQHIQNFGSSFGEDDMAKINNVIENFLQIEQDAEDFEVEAPAGFHDLVQRFRTQSKVIQEHTTETDKSVKKADCSYYISIVVSLSEKIWYFSQDISRSIELKVQKEIEEGQKRIRELNSRMTNINTEKPVPATPQKEKDDVVHNAPKKMPTRLDFTRRS